MEFLVLDVEGHSNNQPAAGWVKDSKDGDRPVETCYYQNDRT